MARISHSNDSFWTPYKKCNPKRMLWNCHPQKMSSLSSPTPSFATWVRISWAYEASPSRMQWTVSGFKSGCKCCVKRATCSWLEPTNFLYHAYFCLSDRWVLGKSQKIQRAERNLVESCKRKIFIKTSSSTTVIYHSIVPSRNTPLVWHSYPQTMRSC